MGAGHSSTGRDGYRYRVEYSPTGAATCRESNTKIAKGALRIGRMTTDPFGSDGGLLKHYFHEEHAWKAFARSRCTSKVPLSAADIEGFGDISPSDKRRVLASLAGFRRTWAEKKKKCKQLADGSRGKGTGR